MIRLLALGLPAGLALIVLTSRKLPRAARILMSTVGMVFSAAVAFLLSDPMLLSDDGLLGRTPWKELLLLGALLSGMTARSIDEAIEDRNRKIKKLREKGRLRKKPKLELDTWNMLRPFLVALPTFGLLLEQVGDQDVRWLMVALAFQTGFFWQTLISGSRGERGES